MKDNLKQMRINTGKSQVDLAEESGIDASHLSRIERGKARPGPKLAAKLAGLLNVTTEQFWGYFKEGQDGSD